MENDRVDVWCHGLVTAVLDEDEYSDDCEFRIAYDGFEGFYDLCMIEGRVKGLVEVEGLVEESDLKKKNIDILFSIVLFCIFNTFMLHCEL